MYDVRQHKRGGGGSGHPRGDFQRFLAFTGPRPFDPFAHHGHQPPDQSTGAQQRTRSFPPSTDGPRRKRKKFKARKKRSGKKPGGQPGHAGTTLEQFEDPDEIIELEIDRRTLPRGRYHSEDVETRQVIDVHLECVIREYQAEVLVDEDGNRFVAGFPPHVSKAIQYGPSVKSLAVYFSQYQLIPYNRVKEVFEDQFGLNISQGSLANFITEAYDKLEGFEAEVWEELSRSKVLHADETGIKVGKELVWLHVLSTAHTTMYFPHAKRGKEAIDALGIIKQYDGVLCHDHWKPYLGYPCEHALCNAHHLRELQWVIDFKQHKWAKSLRRFLVKLAKQVDEAGGVLSEALQERRTIRYREILSQGRGECPIMVRAKGSNQRGRIKQSKERNLLDRLIDYEDQTLLFMRRKHVPFTNNQAERDIRMIKVHQKISGHFRSMAGAKHFARIRGFLMTSRKHGHSPHCKLVELFDP